MSNKKLYELMDELKSCPFCGSNEVSLSIGSRTAEYPSVYFAEYYYVECHECAALGPESHDKEEQAITNWNTRA